MGVFVILFLLLWACSPSGGSVMAPQLCGPFVGLRLPSSAVVSSCSAAQVSTLFIRSSAAPALLCSQFHDLLLSDGWVSAVPSPEIGGTVNQSLQKSQDQLNMVCTDVAGETTATLSLHSLP